MDEQELFVLRVDYSNVDGLVGVFSSWENACKMYARMYEQFNDNYKNDFDERKPFYRHLNEFVPLLKNLDDDWSKFPDECAIPECFKVPVNKIFDVSSKDWTNLVYHENYQREEIFRERKIYDGPRKVFLVTNSSKGRNDVYTTYEQARQSMMDRRKSLWSNEPLLIYSHETEHVDNCIIYNSEKEPVKLKDVDRTYMTIIE